jgi:dynein heavy chain 1
LSPARHPDTLQRCTRFADAQVALYVQKDLAPTKSLDNGGTDDSRAASQTFLGPGPARC